MKVLFFGDPEGVLQKRKKFIKKLVDKFKPDVLAFAGDYFSWAYPYLIHYSRYKKSKDFFDLFPEMKLANGIDVEQKIFVYGNKDILLVRKI